VSKFLRLRSQGIGKHPIILNEKMLTPFGANHLLCSWWKLKFYRFLRTRIKADASQYVCYVLYYLTIRKSFYSSTYYLFVDMESNSSGGYR